MSITKSVSKTRAAVVSRAYFVIHYAFCVVYELLPLLRLAIKKKKKKKKSRMLC
jgi:hypothetical protein